MNDKVKKATLQLAFFSWSLFLRKASCDWESVKNSPWGQGALEIWMQQRSTELAKKVQVSRKNLQKYRLFGHSNTSLGVS